MIFNIINYNILGLGHNQYPNEFKRASHIGSGKNCQLYPNYQLYTFIAKDTKRII